MMSQAFARKRKKHKLDPSDLTSVDKGPHVIWIHDGNRPWAAIAWALGATGAPGCSMDTRETSMDRLIQVLMQEAATAPPDREVCIVVTCESVLFASDPTCMFTDFCEPLLHRLAALARASSMIDTFWVSDAIANIPGALERLVHTIQRPIGILPKVTSYQEWSVVFPDAFDPDLTVQHD